MRQFFLGSYLLLVSCAGVSCLTFGLFSPFVELQTDMTENLAVAHTPLRLATRVANTVPETKCAPVNSDERTVNGIASSDVPLLPGAARLSYADDGTSQYTTRESGAKVLNYYATVLPTDCWEYISGDSTKTAWQRGNEALLIALAENGLGQKTIVTYSGNTSAVLGLKVAQTDGGTSQEVAPVEKREVLEPLKNESPEFHPLEQFEPKQPPFESKQPPLPQDGQKNMRQPRPDLAPKKMMGSEGEREKFMEGENESEEGMSERQKQMDEQRLKMMKQGIKQFEKGLKQMQQMVKRMTPKLSKAGVGVPAELTAAMEKAPEVIAKIKASENAEDMEALMDDVMDVSETMREWGPKLGELTRLVDMLNRSGKDLNNMKKKVATLEKAVKKNPATEGMVQELKTQLETMAGALSEAKTLAGTDAEASLEKIEADFYDSMEEFWNAVAEVEMMQNLSKGIAQAKSEINKATARVRALERSKKAEAEDVAQLKEMITGLKESLTEIQTLSKDKSTDADTMRSAAEELWGKMEEFEDKMNELGQSTYDPGIKAGQGYKFEPPQGFEFKKSEDSGEMEKFGEDPMNGSLQASPAFPVSSEVKR